ncbi:major facilitator superfamily domain-containing protein [Armillaria borealis]|uniref:Major facilitator superfamily domain-containing protein n=1 Tax=Armillaria borealis TaxID=47425 RepID=A0AA39MDY5_9AGAR|nr:major facilitator superfamily domain-containing protein [Armillaria borealis]
MKLERAGDSTDEFPRFTKDFGFLPIPHRLRYDPEKPFHFGLLLNISFGFASTFVVANLYYCQPLLIEMSKSFNVTYDEVSTIPTLVQAGYAVGLLLLSPLGDLVRRRGLILVLVTLSASLSIPLAITNKLVVFEVFSFFVGVVTRRASALSVVLSGLLLGVLIARVISGVIAQFTSWRVVYYMSVGVQFLVLGGSYLVLPDYPAKNKDMTYWKILWTMAKFAFTEPILIQACLTNIASSASFSNFWVTLTFLLGSPPYNYTTLVIGLFGLVGMFGVAMGPLIGRTIDKLIPWYASLIAIIGMALFQAIQVGAGGINIAAVIIATFGLDVFRQMLQVSLATSIFSIAPEARARLNAVYILSVSLCTSVCLSSYSWRQLFIGQVMGTSVGSEVFIKYGWRAGAALSLGWSGWQLFMLLLRGPHCERRTWFGYQGGLEPRKSVVEGRKRLEAEQSNDGERTARNSGEQEKERRDNDTVV